MTDSTAMRLSALAIVALSLVGALTARLWFLTAVEGEAAVETAQSNRIRTLHIQAPRGRIFDREQRVLVDNTQVRQLRVDTRIVDESVDYDEDARDQIYTRLAEELTLAGVPTPAEACPTCVEPAAWTLALVEEELEDNFIGAFIPTPVADDVPEELEVALAERHYEFPGIDVERVAVRSYPHGSLAAHALGYVGRITEDELEREDVAASVKPYAPTDEIGKAGVEAAYEPWLRGTPGERVIEVDAQGDVVREISYTPPTPGLDVVLTLDLSLQALLEAELAAEAEGRDAAGASAVVLDPRNGGVVAMASWPTYDPQSFVDGFSAEEYAELTDEENGLPLNNRVTSGVYAPGSTFKPVTALAGLRAGIVGPDDFVNDTGTYYVRGCGEDPTCEFSAPGDFPNGPVDLARALAVSSNYYFYSIGDNLWARNEELGEDFLQETAVDWGFDAETGIDLPQEQEGFAYTPAQLRELHEQYPEAFPFGDEWRAGNTINMSIGQGDLGVTPLQLANMYAAIANGGTLYRPHVGGATWEPRPAQGSWQVDSDEPCRVQASADLVDDGRLCTVLPSPGGSIEIPVAWREAMVSGLLQVVTGGTANDAFEGFDVGGFPVAGKTGSAQVAGADNALFASYGPVRPGQVPEYAIAVVLEGVEAAGGEAAAPVARAFYEGVIDPSRRPPVAAVYATPVPSTTAGSGQPAAEEGR